LSLPGAPAPAYHEAVAALASRGRFGIRLGLGRTRALLRELGHPETGLRGVLIGGTNGKGSVLALVGSALRAAGHRVGETPKPHLVSYRERIQVEGRPIGPDDFARLAAEVLPIADRVARRYGDPTEFELLTAMIFRWFALQSVGVAVVEVGLGGRLDATHAWDGGVAAITNVDLDHTDRLGPTIVAIAREKAAIIERGDRAVTGASGQGLAVIRRRARRLGAPLVEVTPAPLVGWDRDGIEVELPGLGPTRVGLRGRHQAANVAVADATLDALQSAGIATTPPDARRAGYASARCPGRLELVRLEGRDIVLDGAHNPAGAQALATAIADLRPYLSDGPLTIVTAVMVDKDAAGIVEALSRVAAVAGGGGPVRIICTRVDPVRGMDPAALAATWSARLPGATVLVEPGPDRALERARDGAEGPIVITGSLYLVGDLRRLLVADPDLEDQTAPMDEATR
jgi:dihydrofolate synthase/folylpolyglutamate synthase